MWHLSNDLGAHGLITRVKIFIQIFWVEILCTIFSDMDDYAIIFSLWWNHLRVRKIELYLPSVILEWHRFPRKINCRKIESLSLLTVHRWVNINLNNRAIEQGIDRNITTIVSSHVGIDIPCFKMIALQISSFGWIKTAWVNVKFNLHSSKLINRHNFGLTLASGWIYFIFLNQDRCILILLQYFQSFHSDLDVVYTS